MTLPMREYVIGQDVYEIVDAKSREDISVLQIDLDTAEDNIKELQEQSDIFEDDIQKLKLVSIEPDTSLGIEGACAESKAVGDALNQIQDVQKENYDELSEKIDTITPSAINAVSKDSIINNMTTVEEGYVLDARQAYELNLLIQKRALTSSYTATFPANNWTGSSSPYTQTVQVDGILETDNPIVDIDMSMHISDDASALATEEWNLIRRIVANNGSITIYCYDEKPTLDITIILKVVR